MSDTNEQVTIKGAVGKFQFGYTGRAAWIIRNRDTLETVGRARNMMTAARVAKRLYEAEQD